MERTAILIPGGKDAAERALHECTKENGGVLVGNPTIQGNLTGIDVEGTRSTVIIFEDDADRHGWWLEWGRVHGCKFAEANQPTERK